MNNKNYDYLIVGSGLFGAVFAHQAKNAGKRCLVIDKRTHQGGNIYCDNQDGINVHMYGAHIFHTSNEEVWNFVNRFVKFNNYINSPLAYYKGDIYNLPFNMNTFNKLWGVITPQEALAKLAEEQAVYDYIKEPQNLEEHVLKLCGKQFYETLIKGYTEKQWGCKATELPASIIKRLPFRYVYNNNYFNDLYQGIPIGGFNPLIDALLDGVEVKLNTNYFDNRTYFDNIAHKTIFTGCIDEYFNYEFGKLDYRSLLFEHKRLDMEDYQGNAVVNYTEYEIPYTRIIEHKHFEFGKQPFTIITHEYPQKLGEGQEPFYPINSEANNTVLAKYQVKAAKMDNIIFGGRLGSYKYADMDTIIADSLKLAGIELATESIS